MLYQPSYEALYSLSAVYTYHLYHVHIISMMHVLNGSLPASPSGVIRYKGAKIQLLDLPGIIEGAKDGKGRGRQVIAGDVWNV